MQKKFIISLIIFQVLLIFVHLAVYATIAASFGFSSIWLEALFVLLGISFIAASLLTHSYANRPVALFYRFAAYWFGLVHFLFGGVVALFIVENAANVANYYLPWAPTAAIALGAFFLLHLYGTWNSGRAEITKRTVKLKNLPEAWRGKKIVFMSDMHLGAVRNQNFAARVVRKINALAPEAVFIGGDVFDGVACNPDELVAPLKDLRAPRGIFYVTGNHEYYMPDPQKGLASIRATGVKILNDEKFLLDGISIVGVDYLSSYKDEDFAGILSRIGIEKSAPSILLKHEPRGLETAEKAGISLGFFGHTHRGQIWPLSYVTRRIYRGYDYGEKPLGGTEVITSSGVGTWGPPLRIGTKSEIVLVEFL